MPDSTPADAPRVSPQLRIDELLDELQGRVSSVRASRDRVRKLLEAVVAIGSGLDVEVALTKIVHAATRLVDARYGALGVTGPDRRSTRFITVGISEQEIEASSEERGLLGELFRNPAPQPGGESGAQPASPGLTPDHRPECSVLRVPVRVRGEEYGDLNLAGKRGGVFDADDEAVLTALAAAAGVAIDNARLFEESQRLFARLQHHYAESRRRQEWLEITGELGRGLLSAEDTEQVMALFVRRVRTFADADLVLLGVPDPQEAGLLIVAADGQGAEALVGSRVALDGTLLGHVYTSGRSALVADMREDERSDRAAATALGVGPAFLAPLVAGGRPRGALSLARRAGAEPFDTQVAEPTAQLAMQAATVLELARRRRDSGMLALYDERDRIGRDLHDLAIRRLFATSMSLQGASKVTGRPEAARRMAQAVTDIDETIKVIRSTIFALHTHETDQDRVGVRADVIEICEKAAAVLGFAPAVRFSGPVDSLTSETAAEHLLAVLREALSNAARHAHATRVGVDVAADAATVTLTVTDDGIGTPEAGRRSGLANQRERAERLGGTCTTGPGPRGGTVLAWTVKTGRSSPGHRAAQP